MSKQKILVIEDERPLVEVLACNLEREGFEVIFAFDGQEGLRQAQLKLPDLIVLDLMLPAEAGARGLPRAQAGPADARHPDHHGDGQGRGVRPACRLCHRRRRLCHEAV